jgi:hypothetical protein
MRELCMQLDDVAYFDVDLLTFVCACVQLQLLHRRGLICVLLACGVWRPTADSTQQAQKPPTLTAVCSRGIVYVLDIVCTFFW